MLIFINCDNQWQSASCDARLLQEVCAFDQQTMLFPWTEAQWESVLAENQYFLFYQKGIGQILFHHVLDDDLLHLLKISVADNQKGSGVAIKVFNDAVALMCTKYPKIRSVYLEVEANNHRAIKFYEKLDFKKLNLIKNFYSDGSHAWAMNKVFEQK